jgi:hypothetical protein
MELGFWALIGSLVLFGTLASPSADGASTFILRGRNCACVANHALQALGHLGCRVIGVAGLMTVTRTVLPHRRPLSETGG